jgi:hypothetical protein
MESPLIIRVIDKIMNPFIIASLSPTLGETDIVTYEIGDTDRIVASDLF